MPDNESAPVVAPPAEDEVGDEVLKLSANVKIEVFAPDGSVKDKREFHNLICTAGKNQLLLYTGAEYINAFKYVALGTSTTAPASGDTALGAELSGGSYARQSGALTNPTSAQLQIVGTFSAGVGTGAITESGLFDASTSGNILTHQTFSVVNVASGDSIVVTWTLS